MVYGHGGNDGVLLRQSGKHIRTAYWLASPHHSPLSHSHQHYHPHHTISMSFSDASDIDNVLGMIYGESSTIPPSHGKKVVPRTSSSRPRGRIQPPRSAGFPRSPLKDKDESLPFNHQKYPHKRGNIFQPYASLTDIQSHAQKKGERFKDLYIRDLVIAGRMKWRGKFHNVETSHFQEEWVARGLELDHDVEEQMIPIVDTCLGYTAVLGAELFNEQERMEEEVSSVFDGCQK